ncbi:MAG: DUF4113 domain-containing protein [Porphyromonas sp.]|nr:DUF4113 domain-containing protein [Porphyromonas sp.]
MYGLIDCNNFYVSCERLFRPQLNGRPVVVLSNNDGCVISRSNEAKALGIPMGIPLFKIKDEIKRHGIEVCSSNYTLYSDLSNRVMSIVREHLPEQEIYSIDECFIRFDPQDDYMAMSRDIRQKLLKGVGIPTCVGISKTKTLAKLANRVAKKFDRYKGVYAIDNNDKWRAALQWVEIGDVWGIGRRTTAKLQQSRVYTAYDFIQKDPAWVKLTFTVTGLNTYMELKGKECIPFGKNDPAKSITRSRSFGVPITDEHQLFTIILEFAEKCCEKLRQQRLSALRVAVLLHTNRFSITDLQQHEYTEAHLTLPSNNAVELTPVLYQLFKRLYRPGYKYKKAGVLMGQLVNESEVLPFATEGQAELKKLTAIAKHLNEKYGKHSLFVAARDPDVLDEVVTRKHTSPNYTTQLSDILKIHPK